jgi:4-amino-4-deoxy-L-arabinose transferase-like glycosyltransferase
MLINRLRSLVDKRYRYLMIAILTIGFILRVIAIFRYLGGDEAAFLYYGWMMVNGKILYRDLFNQKAPGVYFIVALIFLLSGKHILLIRVLSMILSVSTALILFGIGKKLSNPLVGIISAILYELEPITLHYSTIVSSETFMVFFMVLAVYFYISAHKKNSTWQYLLVGVFIGLSTLMRQTGIILLVVIVCHRLYIRDPLKSLLRSIGTLLIGTLISVLPIIGYFLAVNALNDVIYATFFFNLSSSYGFSFLNRLDTLYNGVFTKDPVLWIVGLGGMLFALERRNNWAIFLMGWFIASFLLVSVLSTPYSHYYIQVMPALSLLGGIFVEKLIVISEKMMDSASQSTLHSNIINWLLVVLVLVGIGTLGERIHLDMKEGYGLPYQLEAAAYIKAHTSPDEIIFSPDSAYYLLTDRQNNYRIEHLASGHIEAFGISDLPQYLESERVSYVITDYHIEVWNFNEETYRKNFNDDARAEEVKMVYEWILAHYELEVTFGSGRDIIKIYHSKFW